MRCFGRPLPLCAPMLALMALSQSSRATVLEAAFSETLFSPSTTQVTGIAWASDGSNRLFVARKNGQLFVIQDGVMQPAFARISPIQVTSECGLIGIALDPGFATNHFLYAFVTRTGSKQEIVRLNVDDGATEPTVIVSGLPTHGANHDGGGIGFGPDGRLYWSVGDNGNNSGVKADLASLAAKVGRANRDGGVPGDNPFVDGDGPNNDYIWARGFRNPFTLTFSPVTGALWVNVTGTNYEQVFVVQAGDHAGWSSYENRQPEGYISPVITYRTNAVDERDVTAAARLAGLTTITCSVTHYLRVGSKVTLTGISDATFDGDGYVVSTPTPTTFTIAQAGADATSAGGTMTTAAIGGALTGGTFWDSSALPADQQGSFMFGDYNSGRIMRAKLNAAGSAATAIDEFANGVDNAVDMDVGPDGALYYAANTGGIYRAAYEFSSQALLVSRLHVRLPEGSATGFAVSLAVAPPAARAVRVQRKSGDADVTVTQGAMLTFDASNWSVPQPVLLGAAQDADTSDDMASFSVLSTGLKTQVVVARVTDDDALAIVVSKPGLTLSEGGVTTVGVSLNGPPAKPTTLELSLSDGSDLQLDQSTLVFDALNWSIPQLVNVAAGQDDDALDDLDQLTIDGGLLGTRPLSVAIDDDDDDDEVRADAPPVCVLTAPHAGDVLSGEMEQFFGHVTDDVGVVGAVFSVDGSDGYSDERSDDVFYFGGSDGAFDTRELADGPHSLRMTGEDTSGQTCFDEVTITVDNQAGGADPVAGAGGDAGVPAGGAGSQALGGAGAGFEPDVSTPSDAGQSSTAASGSAQAEGCNCRLARSGRGRVGSLLALLALASFSARRRQGKASAPRR